MPASADHDHGDPDPVVFRAPQTPTLLLDLHRHRDGPAFAQAAIVTPLGTLRLTNAVQASLTP